MSQLPLVIGGQLIDFNQLAGFNYVQGFPELMDRSWRHNRDAMIGYTENKTFIYPLPGKQRIYASPGKSWKPGSRLRAYRAGNVSDWRIVNVISYNTVTGELYIEIVGSSTFETAAMGGTAWLLTPFFTDMTQSAALPIANGGTAATSVDDARASLMLPHHSRYAHFYSDFIQPVSYCRIGSSAVDEGMAIPVMSSVNLSEDFATHPGIYRLGVNTGHRILGFGRYCASRWTDFSGDDTLFEMQFRLPALSSSGSYNFECGLIGTSAKITVAYTDTANSGRFQYIYGANASYSTSNSTLTVVAGTWYKMSIAVSGANINISIGAQSINTSKAPFQGVSSGNRMMPATRLTRTSGSPIAEVDYMYFRKHFTNGR